MSGREKPCLVLPQNNLGSSCPFALSHLKLNIDLSSSMKKPLLDLVIACRRVNILTMSRLLISEHSVYEQGTCTLLHCFSHVQLFATPWTPGSSVPGILQAKYWHGSPCPPPEDLPNPGIEPSLLGLLHWQVDSLPLVPPQFSSVAQSCPTLCDSMDCSPPGFPVHHQLLEPTQTHVCCVSDAIQPFHSLSSPSPPAFNLSQHQGLFQ